MAPAKYKSITYLNYLIWYDNKNIYHSKPNYQINQITQLRSATYRTLYSPVENPLFMYVYMYV